MSLSNKSNCIILTSKNNEYKRIEDVPINEYPLIHTVKDIHPDYFKSPLFNKIKEWTNLKFVSFDIKNYKNQKFINKIANFKFLSIVLLIDYEYSHFTQVNKGKYIFENKMTIFFPSISELDEIPANIEYLNIIDDGKTDYANIPYNIKHLHLTIRNNKFKQSNLPISLEDITITVPEHFRQFVQKEDIENNIKIPFGCKLIIDNLH